MKSRRIISEELIHLPFAHISDKSGFALILFPYSLLCFRSLNSSFRKRKHNINCQQPQCASCTDFKDFQESFMRPQAVAEEVDKCANGNSVVCARDKRPQKIEAEIYGNNQRNNKQHYKNCLNYFHYFQILRLRFSSGSLVLAVVLSALDV